MEQTRQRSHHPATRQTPRRDDYQRIARAIDYVMRHAAAQPSLAQIAAHLHLSPWHFQRLFARWAGVTPKRYLQVLTVARAKVLLAQAPSLLSAAGQLGVSSASRLHDHFVTLEAVTPGEYQTGGAGLLIHHGVHATPFGRAFIASTARGICRLAFLEGTDPDAELATLRAAWPQARLATDRAATGALSERLFRVPVGADRPLSLLVRGTNFQVSVWRALLRIPPGQITTYARIAEGIGAPGAARAVGQAVGANPLAFVIPCHRVIRETGALGGYHWGVERKQALHVWEAARHDPGV